ncbi:MAG: thiamine-phosphate kinase [Candidatus Thiodiazotropha lotti]|uniref:Thiamine-monophosphate kinase n=1 Tax=Candidatus Thiodiazotropha lotti TaxID=2792787 RepID=A0A9E4MZT6_9GAMM|nr:thiamine-phosphate kinase [Candidatus Thiodiazotropha lotti]MCG7938090.1 thiamine-phosphate kinase [Candidatus Thiodiazotropha lotti]MCW4202557.1 thiamine-phosphate kinase [Candidatus Thiodiazotropha lotti]ODC02152.1 thiamine-phosphate kinase [Candidatus Thiodiazotropha endoloripes]
MKSHKETPEFALINQYFKQLTTPRQDVVLGVGDDAALLQVSEERLLVVSVDTMVSGVHFFEDVAADALGHKALAVNLSDMAAMGAEPSWATLALTLPEVDEQWIVGFCRGFAGLANRYNVSLVGGDTTRGPLSVTVQIHGMVPKHQVMRRDGAQVGDDIYVTGSLGDAAMGLKFHESSKALTAGQQTLVDRLERPQPRVEAGVALRHLAHSAIDLSDGLLADLGHILTQSGVGASLQLERLPLSAELRAAMGDDMDWSRVVSAGDDYELCLTLPVACREAVAAVARQLSLPISRVGCVEAELGLRCFDKQGKSWHPPQLGFDHFSAG